MRFAAFRVLQVLRFAAFCIFAAVAFCSFWRVAGFRKNLMLFGLGERDKYGSTRFKEVTNRMLRALVRMQCSSFLTVMPGDEALNILRGALNISAPRPARPRGCG